MSNINSNDVVENKYKGTTAPPDKLIIRIGCLVDPEFRAQVWGKLPIKDRKTETYYAELAKKSVGLVLEQIMFSLKIWMRKVLKDILLIVALEDIFLVQLAKI